MEPEKLNEKFRLDDSHLIEFLASKSSEIVDKKVRAREEKRARITALVFSTVALLGIGGIVTLITSSIDDKMLQLEIKLSESFENKMDDKLEQHAKIVSQRFIDSRDFLKDQLQKDVKIIEGGVDNRFLKQEANLKNKNTQIDQTLKKFTQTINSNAENVLSIESNLKTTNAMQLLGSMAVNFDLSESFTPEDRDYVLSLIKTVLNDSNGPPPFFVLSSIEKVMDSFMESSQYDEISQIEEMLGFEDIYTDGIYATLCSFNGLEIICTRESNKQRMALLQERFEMYARRLQNSDYNHIHTPWTILFLAKEGEGSDDLIKQELDLLDAEERSNIKVVYTAYAMLAEEPDIYPSKDVKVGRLCQTILDQNSDYFD